MKVWKSIVLDGKMGIYKFGSVAPPFSKVACLYFTIKYKAFYRALVSSFMVLILLNNRPIRLSIGAIVNFKKISLILLAYRLYARLN